MSCSENVNLHLLGLDRPLQAIALTQVDPAVVSSHCTDKVDWSTVASLALKKWGWAILGPT